MSLLEEIIHRRRQHRLFDEELWDFHERVHGRSLQFFDSEVLLRRLARIERNIQFLDTGPSRRDELPPDRGWLSPWWWLRNRHWTLSEIDQRGLPRGLSPVVDVMPALRPEFHGLFSGGNHLLVRVSRVAFLMDTLKKGRLRFAPARSYKDIEGDDARADDEMTKSYRRPGQVISITGPDGKCIEALGDVTFSTSRSDRDALTPAPYWLISWSTDLDPRLIAEFAGGANDDAVLVVFDCRAFLERTLAILNTLPWRAEKMLTQIEYFDDLFRHRGGLVTMSMKDMRFACQRESRLILDPGVSGAANELEELFVNIGSIEDIAAVYAPDGNRLAGSGPSSFLA